MEEIINDLENLIIRNSNDMNENNSQSNNNNNANVEQQRSFIMQNLRMVHPFSGQKDKLGMYIRSIESILPNIRSLPRDDRVLFFNSILTTLHDEALDMVRREQPTDWASLKSILIDEFGEHQPIPQLILSINNIKFKGNSKLLCDKINKLVCNINDAIELCSETEGRKLFFRSEVSICSLNVLKRELPVHLVALLNANLVRDFKSGVKILRENNVFGDNTNAYFESNNRKNFSRIDVRPQIINNEFRNFATANRRFSVPFGGPQNGFQTHPRNSSQNAYQGNFNSDNNYRNNKRMREQDSNQSRLRRFGVPVPMEVENFLSTASNHFPLS